MSGKCFCPGFCLSFYFIYGGVVTQKLLVSLESNESYPLQFLGFALDVGLRYGGGEPLLSPNTF